MVIRRCILILGLALGPGAAAAQVEVVGPSFAALSVPDLAASVQWYRDIFGLNVVFEAAAPDSSTRVVLLAGRGLRVEFVWHRTARSLSSYAGAPTAPDQVFGPAKLGFFVADLDAALASLRRHGATIEGLWLERPGHVPPEDTLWTRNILVRDNSGNYLQLFERRP
ncbi:MAG: VOC family protein [Gemmatimonadetes bacterium]|nr:VOC family protein [Gemmatimonadota bacterium]